MKIFVVFADKSEDPISYHRTKAGADRAIEEFNQEYIAEGQADGRSIEDSLTKIENGLVWIEEHELLD